MTSKSCAVVLYGESARDFNHCEHGLAYAEHYAHQAVVGSGQKMVLAIDVLRGANTVFLREWMDKPQNEGLTVLIASDETFWAPAWRQS